MKRLLWLTMVLLLTGLPGWAVDPPTSPAYVNQEWGFTIPVPKGWYFKPSPLRLAEAPGCLNSRTGTAYVYVLIRDARGLSCKEMGESQLQEILKTSGKVAITPGPRGPLTVAGRSGYRVIWQSQLTDRYTSYPAYHSYVRAFLPLPAGKVLVLAGASLALTPDESEGRLNQLVEIIDGLRFR